MFLVELLYHLINFVGKNDKIAADKAAVDSMRKELNKIDMKGRNCDRRR